MHIIRPHHLLCIQFYRGKGYSQAFCDNMSNVIAHLNQVEIVVGADDICAKCDNFVSVCKDEAKSGRYDKAVMKLLDILPNTQYNYQQLRKQVEEKIISKGLLCDICADCQWYYICSQGK